MAEETPGKALVPMAALTSTKDQKRIRTTRFQSVYANNVAISFSTFDVTLLLGEIIAEENDEPVIEEFLKLNMSREMAKMVAVLLGSHIRGWEQRFGEIKIPDLSEPIDMPEAEEPPAEEQRREAAKPPKRKPK